jgi:hypothetical protein
MTELLRQAIREMEKLPSEEQDALAAWILAELASERRWTQLLNRSQDVLAQLAQEALEEHRRGETQPLE